MGESPSGKLQLSVPEIVQFSHLFNVGESTVEWHTKCNSLISRTLILKKSTVQIPRRVRCWCCHAKSTNGF